MFLCHDSSFYILILHRQPEDDKKVPGGVTPVLFLSRQMPCHLGLKETGALLERPGSMQLSGFRRFCRPATRPPNHIFDFVVSVKVGVIE